MKIVWMAAMAAALVGCKMDASDRGQSARAEDAPAKGSTSKQRSTGRADASKLTVTPGQTRLDTEMGFVKIAGEIKNDTGHTITSARVTIRLFDASGKELQSSSVATAMNEDFGRDPLEHVYSDRTFIPPGEVGVFYFLRDMKKIKGVVASHKLSVEARDADAKDVPLVEARDVVTPKAPDGRWSASGRIENRGSFGCRTPKAIIGLYNHEGKLAATTTVEPDEMFQKVLAPGRSVAFSSPPLREDGVTVTSLKVWADCSPLDG